MDTDWKIDFLPLVVHSRNQPPYGWEAMENGDTFTRCFNSHGWRMPRRRLTIDICINSDTALSETEACQRVEALDVAALLLNSTIVLTNICWHHHQHSAFSQSIKKMESSLSSEESHKSSLDEGWIEFPGYGLMSGTWVLTTTPPSEHTWLGILAIVQSTGRLNLYTGWTHRPPWRFALNLHHCGYFSFHF